MNKTVRVRPQFFTLFIPMYMMVVHFSVNQTTEQICNEPQIDGEDSGTYEAIDACNTMGRIIYMDENTLLCVLRKYDDGPDARSVLAHEVNHILNFLLKKIGAVQDVNNDEYCCYITQYIFQEFYENIKF